MTLPVFTFMDKIKTVRMKALRSIYYDRDLKPGEEFDVSNERHRWALTVTGAAVAVEADESKKRQYKRRDLEAEK